MRTIIHSAKLVSPDSIEPDVWLEFEARGVTARGTGATWRGRASGAEVVDAAGRWITPGFIDLHCHGGGGSSVEDGPDGIRAALDLHNRHGTTRLVLSLVSAAVDTLAVRVRELADAAERDERILGSHLEGPFLSPRYRGAHDADALCLPHPDSINRLFDAGRGTVRQLTLAPELDGAFRAIGALVDAGVTVAVGHTSADYETTARAFDAGASVLTHAFNGMPGIHHRAPGPVLAAVGAPHVALEIINDGVHVHPDVVSLAFRAAPGRVAMVTDAVAGAGASDGEYWLGSSAVAVRQGVARSVATGSIAGSTLTADAALRNAVQVCGIGLREAVAALTIVPARALKIDHRFGRLDVGFAADVTILDSDLQVDRVWIGGESITM